MQKQGQFSITLVCFILGIMLAVQFRTTQDIRSSVQYQRTEDLTQRLMQVETGVIVTMDDTKPTASPNSKNPNLYLIKDEDILKILNELRAAGAEAIAINNQRLIASSEVRTAGPFISINNMNFAAPFEIKAIGDPITLENALKIRGGVIETLQFWGIQVVVKQQDIVQIPAFKGTFRFQYAQPVQNGGK